MVIGCLNAAAISSGLWPHEAFSPVPECVNSVSDNTCNEEATEYDQDNISYSQPVVLLIAISILETVATLTGEAVHGTGTCGASTYD